MQALRLGRMHRISSHDAVAFERRWMLRGRRRL